MVQSNHHKANVLLYVACNCNTATLVSIRVVVVCRVAADMHNTIRRRRQRPTLWHDVRWSGGLAFR